MEMWMAYVVLLVSIVGWLLWWWNEIWYVRLVKARCSTFNPTKLPPGHLGFPLLGETLSFLRFFNIIGRYDDFISSKRYKYKNNNVGIYRTHLYGSPSIIVLSRVLPTNIIFGQLNPNLLRLLASFEMWMAYVVLLASMVGWLLWWWNEIWYARLIKARSSTFNTTKLPPGHLGFPLLGETLTFLWFFNIVGRPDDFISSKKYKYGNNNAGIYRTHLYGSPSIIASSPSLCKFVLNSSDKFVQEWPTAEVLGSSSVITLHKGPLHSVIKNFVMTSINRPDSLSRIVLQIQPTIVAALQLWSQMPKIKAIDQVKKVTLDYTMRYTAHLEEATRIDGIEKLFEGIVYGFRAQPLNLPGTTYHHALKCREKITKTLKEELEKRRQKKNNKNSVAGETTRSDLMDGLMEMKYEQGRHLSDEEVLDNVMSTILVGHISIAYVVTWALHFLAKCPHVLQKLREENMAVLKDKNNGTITYEDIMKLKYTNKVAEETIRMANLSAFVFRKAIDDIEYKGYIIPKDWSVIVWLRGLHNDPTHFEDPMSFDPDRWDTRPKYGTYQPFGGGSRSCPGSALVRASLSLFLHHLSIGYKWKLLNPGARINYLSHPLPSDGLEISISKI